ncbi:MAG: LysR family transcriptional regulator [Chloroflexota bacterium]|nr:LysR family transcriptional regulator [Chloroflexota bacterium]MBI5704865.1 LysR family transcriptional regulator [Chloroflexota bacterium]
MFELSHLRVFLTAAEEKNFSQAAKRLHMSQSAVSQSIQALERACHAELFIRSGRSVELSEAGQTILPMVREVLLAARLLEDSLQEINNQIGGELLIGCSTSAGRYLLPLLLAEFRQNYPAVYPRVKVMSRDGVVERLLNRIIPIGVSSKFIEHRDIVCTPFFEDRIVLIVNPNHPWAAYGHALPADLLDQPIIKCEETTGTCETIMEGLKQHQISMDALNIVMELGSTEAVAMTVERGVGIAFVSEMVAARGLALGRLKKVEVEGMELRRKIYMARHIGLPFTQTQTLFWDFVKSQYEKINNELWDSLVRFEPPA